MSASAVVEHVPSVREHRVLGELHRSGMSVLYLADDVRLSRRVAVKMLRASAAADEWCLRRFLREAAVTANLDHPNIVPVYSAGESGGLPYFVMPYLSAGDLSTLLATRGRLCLADTISVVTQVAAALDYVHDTGLVHRDVKPQNVVIGGRRTHLCDFGISTGAGERHRRGFEGSAGFSSPEQTRGQVVDRRSDVYSLGCVLYFCLTGTEPGQDGPDLSAAGLPMRVAALVGTATAARPEDRFPSCGSLAAALAALR